jgi:hypothetical protein
MTKITLSSNASGTGNVNFAAPNTNSSITVTLPTSNVDMDNLSPSTTAGAVGTYAFLGSDVIISEGSTTAASNLQFAGSPRLSAGNAPSGTWQCMGMIYRTGYSDATVFVRIS